LSELAGLPAHSLEAHTRFFNFFLDVLFLSHLGLGEAAWELSWTRARRLGIVGVARWALVGRPAAEDRAF
jgi:hypothetical protein